jgi:hypothetical protein
MEAGIIYKFKEFWAKTSIGFAGLIDTAAFGV